METGWNGTLDLNLVRHSSEALVAFVPSMSVEDPSVTVDGSRVTNLLS